MEIDLHMNCIKAFDQDSFGGVQQIIRGSGTVTAILAHGPGKGVGANIAATFSAHIFSSMAKRDERFDDIASAVSATMPDSGAGNIPSSFSILQVSENGLLQAVEANMPPFLLLHRGRKMNLEPELCRLGGRIVKRYSLTLKASDTLVIYNYGVTRRIKEAELIKYLLSAYKPKISAQKLTELLLSAASWLSQKKPSEDLSVMTLRALKTIIRIPEYASVRHGGTT